jgi:CBS domain-containing protein
VLDERGTLNGVVTRRVLLEPALDASRPVKEILRTLPKFVYEDSTVRQAADHMLNHNIGRLPVVSRQKSAEVLGIVTRSDILSVYRRRTKDAQVQQPSLQLPKLRR